MVLVYGEIVTFGILQSGTGSLPFGLGITATAVFEIIVGAGMLGGGIVVLIFSLVSVVAGGGWLVGLVLGLCGAVIDLLRR